MQIALALNSYKSFILLCLEALLSPLTPLLSPSHFSILTSPHIVTNVFLVMRTCKIHSLSNFQHYNIVCCALYLHDLFYNRKYIPFDSLFSPPTTSHLFTPLPITATGNYQSVLCVFCFRF